MTDQVSEGSALLGFEEQLRSLEELVARMERGDQSLEQAFTDYQKGVALVKHCQEALHFAEQKVAVLSKKADQSFELQSYEKDTDDGGVNDLED